MDRSMREAAIRDDHRWALVLAAGEGTRLREITTTSGGIAIPKQYCSLRGHGSLLHDTLQRAAAVASTAHICVVVAAGHEVWWRGLRSSICDGNLVVQPRNRGTAIGILLPLLDILRRDPEAVVLVLPSDHFVRDEWLLEKAMCVAMARACETNGIVLLGVDPEGADPDLGYIVPQSLGRDVCGVAEFIEKPDATTARYAIAAGGLWNTFIFAARARSLRQLFADLMPQMLAELEDVSARITSGRAEPAELATLYDRLPSIDFSHDVLKSSVDRLQVLRVPACGWSDLGTPQRVAQVLRTQPYRGSSLENASCGFLNLSAPQQLAALRRQA